MMMASIAILLFIPTVSCVTTIKGFVTVQCKTENTGQYGQTSLLECVVRTTQQATNLQIRVVTWKKVGADETLVVFNRGDTEQKSGYSLAEPSWNAKNMNVSLLITNTAVHDEGDYTCMVMTSSGAASNRSSLKVTAKYSAPTIKPIPETIDRNTEGALVCNSDGGYPEGALRWFDHDGVEWSKSAKMEVKQTRAGLFQLTSELTLLQGSIFSQYTCIVFNSSGGKEDEAIFVIPDSPNSRDPSGSRRESELQVPGGSDPSSKIVAPVVVIGSLIVGLLAVLVVYYRRRTQQARRHSSTPLMSEHLEVRANEPDVEEGDYQESDKEYRDSQP